MALADYYLCDKCGCKTFYDARLPYENDDNHNPQTHVQWPDGNVGYMLVLCRQCTQIHTITVTPIKQKK